MERPNNFQRAQEIVEQDADKNFCKQRESLYRVANRVDTLLAKKMPRLRPIFSSATAFQNKIRTHQQDIERATHTLTEVYVPQFEYGAEQARIAREAQNLRLDVEEETSWGGGRYAVHTIEGVLNGKNIRVHAEGMYHESWHGGKPRPWRYVGFTDEETTISGEEAERIYKRYSFVLSHRNEVEDRLNRSTRPKYLHTHHRNIFDYFKTLQEPDPRRLITRKYHEIPTI